MTIQHDLSADDYHAIDALSASGLKLLAKSPAHWYGCHRAPERPLIEPTPAMKLGTLTHCAVLEPHTLTQRYVVLPPGLDLRTKAGKEWRDAQTLEVISEDQLLAATRMSASVNAIPDVAGLLREGHSEVSALWTDKATGIACKCRPDWVHPAGKGVILLDLKTCTDASPEGFAKQVLNFSYHLQAAWYSKGYEQASGLPVLGFVFAAVEKDWPHAAAAYMLDETTLASAERTNARLVETFERCNATGIWPGYETAIQPLSLPKWARLD